MKACIILGDAMFRTELRDDASCVDAVVIDGIDENGRFVHQRSGTISTSWALTNSEYFPRLPVARAIPPRKNSQDTQYFFTESWTDESGNMD